jgi:outer membrane lipoprotein-sorting protein
MSPNLESQSHSNPPRDSAPSIAGVTVSRPRRSAWLIVFAAAAVLLALAAIMRWTAEETALAKVNKALRQVTTATYTVTQRVGDGREEVTSCGLREGVTRTERPDGIIFIYDPARKRLLELIPGRKAAVLTEDATQKGNFDVVAFFSDLNRNAATVRPIGSSRQFGPKRGTGFEVEAAGIEYDVWVDPSTSLPLYVEFERRQIVGNRGGNQGELEVRQSWGDFTFDQALDAALFDATPPAGYVVDSRSRRKESGESAGEQLQAAGDRIRSAQLAEEIGRLGGTAEVYPTGEIHTVNLTGTAVDDAWLAQLSNVNSTLRTLVLRDTRITDDGMKHVQRLRRLVLLNIAGTEVTDAGLKHLASLPTLTALNVAETQITDAGIAELKRARPKVFVSKQHAKSQTRGRGPGTGDPEGEASDGVDPRRPSDRRD